MSQSGISRRKLLASVPVACLLTISNSVLMAGTQQHRKLRFLAGVLVRQLKNKRSACVLGREYLRSAIHEADIGILVPLILSDPEGQALSDPELDHDSCHAYLQHRFKSDFKNGHVVDVGCWILSETEARVYALAATITTPFSPGVTPTTG